MDTLFQDARSWTTRAATVLLATLLVSAVVVPASSAGPNDIEGIVYRDTNFDGAKADEPGQAGVVVRGTDAAGTSITTLSGPDGSYQLDVSSLTGPVRVEFVLPDDLDYLRPGSMGTDNRSDVVIASAGDVNVDFGVVNPADFCEDNPDILTSCYTFGEQTSNALAVLVETEFKVSGDAVANPSLETPIAYENQIGTTYGLGIQTFLDRDQDNDEIWAASFMKRFSGYGPSGPGAIYRLDRSGAVLGTVTIAAGFDPHDFTPVDNPDTGFVEDDAPDPLSYGEVGKQAFGDLDVSEDQTKVYVVNMFDRSLYEIDADPDSGTFETVTDSWPLFGLAGQTCGGTIRPGAIGINDGTVYVGTTCDDASVAYVHSLDLDSGAGTLVLTIPLNYLREEVGADFGLTAEWRAWNDTFVADTTGWGFPEVANPQPWMTDIDFGTDGMVIGIRDRYGDQTGDLAPSPAWPDDPNLYRTDAAGDILWACESTAGFTLEGGPGCTPPPGGNNPSGPGGAEWFHGDLYLSGGLRGHEEISLGGLFMNPTNDEVIMTAYDALDDSVGEYAFSQGLARLSKATGAKIGQFRVTDTPFGKAGGLGDIEGFCIGAPVEIGNYVWIDDDGDGVQDPNELPLEGVLVTNTETGETATTGPDGYYSFVVDPGDDYTLTFDTSDVTMVDPDYLILTPEDVGDNDEVDSDATITGGGLPTITGTAGTGGDNDHSHDVGFIPTDNRIGNLVWFDSDGNAAVDAAEPAIAGIGVQLFQETGTVPGFDATDTLVDSTTTDATGNYWFEPLLDGPTNTYYVAIPADQSANTLTIDGQTIQATSLASSPGGTLENNDDDNGDDGAPAPGYLSVSGPIDLDDDNEPTGETDANTTTDAEVYVEANGADDFEDDRSNLTIDLGFVQTNRIGNLVWLDGADGEAGFNDGIAQPAESADGIGNVTVQLYQDSITSGTPGEYDAGTDLLVATTTTDADGVYWFSGLQDGTYFAAIPDGQTGQTIDGEAADLDDYLSSTAAVSSANDGIDDRDDGDAGFGFISVSGPIDVAFTLNPVDEQGDFGDATDDAQEAAVNTKDSFYFDDNSDLTIDFGFVKAPKYALGNLVWVDLDDDGIAEDGEPGIGGVTVTLYDDQDVLVDTTVTDTDGSYSFEDLRAGDYTVVIPAGQTGQTIDGGGSVNLDDLLTSAVVVSDPDEPTDIDNDSNGVEQLGGAIASGDVSLGDPDVLNPTEPTDETLRFDLGADDDDGGTTTDEQRNFTVDFGFAEPLRVGNLVWLDDGDTAGTYTSTDEDDGIADLGEIGIEGVLVQLLNEAGTVIAETVTDSSGNYWFDGLRAANYQIGIPTAQTPELDPQPTIVADALEGLRSSTGISVTGETADDDDDGNASGAFASLSELFTLSYRTEATDEGGDFVDATPGAAESAANTATYDHLDNNSSLEIDFGFSPTPTYRLGNLVWEEIDKDGIAEVGEPGIPNVLVQLLDEDGTILSETLTGVDGKYEFTNLTAGDYQVRLPADQLATLGGSDGPAALFQNYASNDNQVAAADNDVDNDNNGVADVAGPTSGLVTLGEGSGNQEATGETDRSNNATLDEDATMPDNRSDLTVDFSLQPLYRLGNLVWEDYDDDGVAEDGEPAIAGVLVQLLDEAGDVIAETVTDTAGHYEFASLLQGDYQVRIPVDQTPELDPQPTIVAGVLDGLRTSGTPNAAADDGTDNDNNGQVILGDFTSGVVSLGDVDGASEPTAETLRDDDATADEDGVYPDARSDLSVDFGFFRGLRLGNQVFLDGQQGDANYDNGIFDAGEFGISGVEVELWLDDGDGTFDPDTDTLVTTDTTDGEGNYAFENVEPDTDYFVAIEDIGEGLATTAAVTDTPTTDDNDNDGAADAASGYDSVSDIVRLSTAATTTGETDTNPAADEAADTEANATGDIYPDTNSEMSVDFGFIDVPLYRIGNLVWEDVDNDGVAEDGETGIEGVTVHLLDADGAIIATDITGPDGKYEFTTLRAGTYAVSIPTGQAVLDGMDSSNNNEETDPNDDVDNNDNGLIDTDAWTSGPIEIGPDPLDPPFGTEPSDEELRRGEGTDDDEDGGFYGDDQSNYSIDFGFLDIPTYSVGNLVWMDSDDDGAAEAGEPGIGGVTVEIYDDEDNLVDDTVTSADGSYLFEDLPAGEYSVVIPAGQTGQTIDDGSATPVDLQDILPSAVVTNDPNDDGDNDSNGIEQLDGSIQSQPISVGLPDPLNPAEPTNETDRVGGPDEDVTATDNTGNYTVDFGFVEPLRVGNLVWLDDGDADGTYVATDEDDAVADPSESGIQGVLVQLLDEDGDVIAETITDANGNYWFDGLRADDYQIGIPEDQTLTLGPQSNPLVDGALDGLRSSTGISTTAETGDDDDDGNPDALEGFVSLSAIFNLDHKAEATDEAGDFGDATVDAAETAANTAGSAHTDEDSNLEVDFGFAPEPTYRLGNLVWEDYDNDGLAEDGEPGIAGVLVQLLDEDGDVIAEMVTDSDGKYEFDDLDASDYQVRIPEDQTPTLGAQPDLVADVLDGLRTSGTPEANADGDTDNDNNGVDEIAGFTSGVITIGNGTGNQEATAETNRDDDATLDEDATMRDDRSNLTADFGFFRGLRLGNQVFLDGQQGDAGYDNGIFDAGEVGISGVDVELWEDDGDGIFDPTTDTLVETVPTDGEGNFFFENLDAATPYFVAVEEIVDGFASSPALTDSPATDDNDNDGAADPTTGYASVTDVFTLTIGSSSTGEADTVPTPDDTAEVEANAATDFYPDANSELQIDLGFIEVPLYRIGNLVWEDIDNDGLAEDGEPGIEGVTVELLNEDDEVVDTFVTGPDGKYDFPSLLAGEYRVSIAMDQPALDGMASSNNNEEIDPNDDGDNNDNGLIDDDAWVSGPVSVGEGGTPGNFGTEPSDEVLRDASLTDDDEDGGFYGDDQSNYSVDFGFLDIPLYSIGNLVWIDSNDDGIADIGEPGIAGVTVELYDEDGVFVTEVTTGPDGSYVFVDLVAADYEVVIPAGQAGQVIDDGAATPVDLDTLLPSSTVGGDPDNDVDNDSNGNEQPDSSLSSGLISVGDPDPLNPDEPTDETVRDGDVDVEPANDIEDLKTNYTVDFGFVEPLRVGNLVWLDDGGESTGAYVPTNVDNGVADPGEAGIAGVLVQLRDSGGTIIAETVTDSNGNYWFDGLRDGEYRIGIPSNQTPALEPLTGIIDGALDGLVTSTVQSSDSELADDDNDGAESLAYITISRTFRLDERTEPVDETGDFDDATPGAAEAAANDATVVHFDSNSNLEIDLGLIPVPTFRLGNLIWEDYDNDGIAEVGEPGIGGVLVQLLDDGGNVIAETVTDSAGGYVFEDLLAGTYQVAVPNDQTPTLGEQPDVIDGVLDGLQTSGTPEADPNTDVDNDGNGLDDDAGGFVSGPISLGEDDGKQEPESETTRADDGTIDEDGALRDDRSNLTVDIGLFRGLRLGNQVFVDGEQGEPGYNNGVLDAGETGISGVAVELWADDGDGIFDPATDELLATTTTDAEGNYLFENVAPATPVFVAISDIGAGTASEVVSTDPTAADNDNDGSPTAGYDSVSPLIELQIGETSTGEGDNAPPTDGSAEEEADGASNVYPDGNSELGVDFGFIDVPLYRIGNLVWNDLDNDGTAETGEPGIEGVTVQLLDEFGAVVLETVTDADGSYAFLNLPPGNYQVSIPVDQPVLATFQSSNQGEEADVNDDGDNNDNGIDGTDAWVSSVIELGPNPVNLPLDTEPTDETVRADDPTDDDEGDGFHNDGRSNHSVDFGFYELALGSQVWLDVDADGVIDADESGIDGVPVILYEVLPDGSLSPVAETTTAPIQGVPGSYRFDGLVHGTEYVVEIPAEAFEDGGPLEMLVSSPDDGSAPDPDEDPTDGDDNGTDAAPGQPVQAPPITLLVGDEPTGEPSHNCGCPDDNENLTVDFGVTSLSLGGTIWEDDDLDGTLDSATEDPIPGVPVELWAVDPSTGEPTGSAPIATTTTGPDGTYLFANLEPGDYVVRIPADTFGPSGELAGKTSTVGNGVMPPDPDDDADHDDNGVLKVDGCVQTAPVTLGYGEEPTGEPEIGPGGDRSDNHTVDLGIVPAPPMSIGNRVWLDSDRSGTMDADEEGIADVIVELIDTATGDVIAETITDEDGYYIFDDLAPGTYTVRIPQSNFESGGPLAGKANTETDPATDPDDDPTDLDDNGIIDGEDGVESAPITLVPTFEPANGAETDLGPSGHGSSDDIDSNMTVDFGFYNLRNDAIITPEETISGAIWLDLNDNGDVGTGDSPIEGVILNVVDRATGEVVETVVTDENGFWEVAGLPPGDYEVVIDPVNFEPGGALHGLDPVEGFDEDDLVIAAGDEPGKEAFGNSVDRVLRLTKDVPPIGGPLALTGGNRQMQQLLAGLVLVLSGGALTSFGRIRRKRHE